MRITETFCYSIFVEQERVESKICANYMHDVEVGFRCPKCNERQKPLAHGNERYCTSSPDTTVFTRHGNALSVTADIQEIG